MRKTIRVIAGVACVLAGCGRAPKSAPPAPGQPGAVAFDLHGRALDGKPIRVADYRGKTLLLNVFSTWCVPCREEFPDFVALARRKKGQPFAVLAVAAQSKPADIRKFAAQYRPPFPLVVPDSDPGDAYALTSVPVTLLIGPDGRILRRFEGPVPKAEWGRL